MGAAYADQTLASHRRDAAAPRITVNGDDDPRSGFRPKGTHNFGGKLDARGVPRRNNRGSKLQSTISLIEIAAPRGGADRGLIAPPRTPASRRSAKRPARPSPPRPRRETPWRSVPSAKRERADRRAATGIAATKAPNAAGVERPDLGLDRRALASRRRAAGRASAASCRAARRGGSPRVVSTSRTNSAPSAVNSRLSGRPDRCAPTTASSMRPERDAAPAPARRRAAGRAHRRARGARGSRAASPAMRPSAPARRDQRHARGQAVARACPRDTAIAREIEQVDEIGVGPELRIERDRIGLDLRDACRGAAWSGPA